MKKLTAERHNLGWTKMELARRARMHPARVGQIEAGRAVPPSNSVELRRLARALGWTGDPGELLGEVEE